MGSDRQYGLAALAVFLLAGCGGDLPTPNGNAAVFERIKAETACDKLEVELDTAMARLDLLEKGTPASETALQYAEAADARMKDVGCYP